MVLHLSIETPVHQDFRPRITVFGVGGGGCNAVNNMINLDLQGVDFVVANTDAQQLQRSRAERRIQLGPYLTQGNGAGGRPDVGKLAADEAAEELARHLENTHMVFIAAGMGGGTGTGAAPVIARMARDRDILTVGVVTKPFAFEGKRRLRAAEEGIAEMQNYVDTLIVIPNQNLFKVANERTGWKEAFEMADDVLYMGVRGITDLMVLPGLVNLDFADVRTVMREMGKAMMGTGEAEGDDRARRAAEAAINNPLLEDTSMKGARGLLINITGGHDVTLFEVDQAANRVAEEVDKDATIMFGMSLDPDMEGKLRVSVVATGIDTQAQAMPNLKVVNGGPVDAVGFNPAHTGQAAHGGPSARAPQAASAAPSQSYRPGAGVYVQEVAAAPVAPKTAFVGRGTELPLGDAPAPQAAPMPQAAPAAMDAAAALAQPMYQPAPRMAPPPVRPAPAGPDLNRAGAPADQSRGNSVFKKVFGLGGAKPAPAPQRQEPAIHAEVLSRAADPAQGSGRPAQVDEAAMNIPTFLRRNHNAS